MITSPIYAALNEHLQTLTGIPTLQLENTRNEWKTGQSFTRATVLPSRPQQMTVGVTGRDLMSGLYQVDLFIPEASGVAEANALADLVIAHFPRGLNLTNGATTVHIHSAWREAGVVDKPFYKAPVVVVWQVIG